MALTLKTNAMKEIDDYIKDLEDEVAICHKHIELLELNEEIRILDIELYNERLRYSAFKRNMHYRQMDKLEHLYCMCNIKRFWLNVKKRRRDCLFKELYPND